MSHNYPYKRPPSDTDLRPDGSYGSSDHRHTSSDHDFYRQPQESFSSSHLSSSSSSSSSASSRGAQWSQDGALSILSSCGLEPSDLALLAELPEDVLTVESLPQVLKQIKGKRGTVKPFPPSAPSPASSSSSYLPSSSRQLAPSSSASDWEHPRSQPLQYPVDNMTPDPLSSELDRWGNPRTCGSVRTDQPSSSSSSSSYMVDFHHRPGPSEYGKTGRDTGPLPSRDYNHIPGHSDFAKTGRDSGPVSPQDYNYRPGPFEYSKTGRDSSPVSSLDYNHSTGPSYYGNMGRDFGPVSSVDYNHRPGPSEYGKTGRDAVPVSSEKPPSFSSTGRDKRPRASRFCQPTPADHRSAPPPLLPELLKLDTSSSLMPPQKQAMDFYGTSPTTYPYSCSLCDITVMSEKVWIKHINGPHHADGQLALLQQFPNWDCRMENISRVDNQSQKRKDEGNPARAQTANQSASIPQANKKTEKKTAEKSKVVCVKFPAQSVDEAYLRKLSEPFGKIVKILMFPSLAFVELGSIDQARDLVKFHANYPPTVNGEQMEFRISKTFNFLQSSRVVCFTPAPTGEDSKSDLISIVKRFGSPLFSLFLPSKAFIEMKNTPDAQKLVDYYSSRSLRVNNDVLTVSYSVEYKSLMRVPSAKRYEEETCSTKRERSSSRETEDKTTETKRKRSSKDREKDDGEKSSRDKRTRSRSRENDTKEKRSRSKDRSSRDRRTRTRSKSREKSSKEKRSRTRSRSRDKSKETSIRGRTSRSRSRSRSRDTSSRDGRTRTRSKSREKSNKEKSTRSRDKSSTDRRSRSKSRSRDESSNQSREKSVVPEKNETTDSESRIDPDPAPVRDSKPEEEKRDETEDEAESSADDSDIEGMEVIGEDGETLENEDVDIFDDADEEEKEEEEEGEGDSNPAERTDLPEPEDDKKEEVKDEEAADQDKVIEEEEKPIHEKEQEKEESIKKEEEESESNREAEETQLEEEQEEPDFPVDLENCITLDELGDNQSDNQDEEVKEKHKSSSFRVVYFDHLPLSHFTDSDFIKVVKDFGTAVRYFRLPMRRKGFIEMSTSAEALRVVNELTSKTFTLSGCKIYVNISNRYKRLSNGVIVPMDKEKRTERRRSERLNRDESDERKVSSKKTPKKDSKKTPEKRSLSKKTPEKDSTSTNTPEKKLSSKKSPEKNSKSQKTPGESAANKKSSEKESASRNSPEKRPEKKSVVKNESEKTSRTPEEESIKTEEKNSAEEESAAKKAPEKEPLSKTSPENKRLKRKGTHENDTVPEKKEKTKESTSDETQRKRELEEDEKKEGSVDMTQETDKCKDKKTPKTEEFKDKKTPKTEESKNKKTPKTEESKDKKTSMMDECKEKQTPETHDCEVKKTFEMDELKDKKTSKDQEETSEPGLKDSEDSNQPDSTGDPPKPQTEPKAAADGLQDSEVDQQCGPAGSAAELQKPTRPVGAEFVRPVVGYFCNLCQLIYADEDEAKLEHCSTVMHYRKYQEKTGKDPWAS
ncbi:neurofilament medium polypeptide-like [Plectropomus leopardus]|uniref:neurofilament medium polypeptide-like n=1 Tax=Plectropomus leopardus TaxID=160734 RepID=UPI001C4D8DBB|nr:neurofilament medium polypeptide-like [Plectropomus leopardus]XP_042349522.1 neurofilament medium polypeptide-like [Plectropomus leopardus]